MSFRTCTIKPSLKILMKSSCDSPDKQLLRWIHSYLVAGQTAGPLKEERDFFHMNRFADIAVMQSWKHLGIVGFAWFYVFGLIFNYLFLFLSIISVHVFLLLTCFTMAVPPLAALILSTRPTKKQRQTRGKLMASFRDAKPQLTQCNTQCVMIICLG